MAEAAFAFAPGVGVRIAGQASIVDAFGREYAPCQVHDGAAQSLAVRFGPGTTLGTVSIEGRHKSVRWRVQLSPAGAARTEVAIALAGAPRSFARSLVQGYIVEPLLSIVAAEQGLVLVPSAGVAREGGVTLILGRSRAGKSTLMVRLTAAGHPVLGDDQLFVAATGGCSAFPRRLRIYPDIETTAPHAFARLPVGLRRRLRFRKLLAAATRGYVRPSLGIDRADLGGHWVPGPIVLERVVLLERGNHSGGLRGGPMSDDDAVNWAVRLLAEQRGRLLVTADAAWRARLERAGEAESKTLAAAFAGRAIERLSIPRDWPAADALAAVGRKLGFET